MRPACTQSFLSAKSIHKQLLTALTVNRKIRTRLQNTDVFIAAEADALRKLFILPRLPWQENCSKYGSSSVSSSIDSSESLPGGVSSTGSVLNSSGMYFVSESDLISGFHGGVNWKKTKHQYAFSVHTDNSHVSPITTDISHSGWCKYVR